MKTLPNLGLKIAAALALGLSASANANGGGFSGSSGSGGSFGHGGGGNSGGGHMVSSVSGGHMVSPVSGGHMVSPVSGGHMVSPVSGGHMVSPFYHGPAFAHSQVSAPHVFSNNRVSSFTRSEEGAGVTRTPTFAFGGRPVNPGMTQNTQRSFTRPNGGWDRHWDRIWHGRHFHWNNGAWVIINDGSYPYGDSYYEPSSSDVYPDMSYDYGDNAPTAPTSSVLPAPAPIPPQAEDTIAADVQGALQDRGYYHGEIDGVIGDGTRSAITDFQKDNDLPITGYITRSLLRALGL